jgi:hypothetical protein
VRLAQSVEATLTKCAPLRHKDPAGRFLVGHATAGNCRPQQVTGFAFKGLRTRCVPQKGRLVSTQQRISMVLTITTRRSEGDADLQVSREECHPILEEMVSNLHDT